MLEDVEAGKIGAVIVKDMSRFGRNYLQTGFYTEMVFPKKQVRFISITNNVDSESTNPNQNDFTPFLNIMNEWYAKDTSNKIKAIFQSRMNEGKRCSGSIPYGYNRLPDDKQKLVVDPVASKVVVRIFELASNSNNPPKIARILTEEKVLIPSAYTLQFHPEQCNMKAEMGNYNWSANSVREILNRKEYLGHTVLRKSVGINFKTDERRLTTEDEQLFFENTHEPIITEELWNEAHKHLEHCARESSIDLKNECVLAGYVYCYDCGRKMYHNTYYDKNRKRCFSFQCSSAYKRFSSCSSHYISEANLNKIVLKSIQRMAEKIEVNEDEFCLLLKKQWEEEKGNAPQKSKKELIYAKIRFDELDRLIGGLYENYVSGIIPERQYKSLMKKYDSEQIELEDKIKRLSELFNEQKESKIDVKRFITIIKKYKEPHELTRELVSKLIDKIVVHKATGKGSNREQQIDIYYNFIGQFELGYTEDEILEANEKEEKEQKEKRERAKKRQSERQKAYYAKKKENRWIENGGHKFAERICEYCGKPFIPNSNVQRFCRKECWEEAYWKLKQQQQFDEKGNHEFKQKKCVVCGKLFWPRNGRQLVCSPECKAKHCKDMQHAHYYGKKAKGKEQDEKN